MGAYAAATIAKRRLREKLQMQREFVYGFSYIASSMENAPAGSTVPNSEVQQSFAALSERIGNVEDRVQVMEQRIDADVRKVIDLEHSMIELELLVELIEGGLQADYAINFLPLAEGDSIQRVVIVIRLRVPPEARATVLQNA